jgi:hypothetical protein
MAKTGERKGGEKDWGESNSKDWAQIYARRAKFFLID